MRVPQSHEISDSQLSARVTDFGASLTDLQLQGCPHSLVLGFPNVESYASDQQYMGAIIGRYANRVAGGTAFIGDQRIQLEQNDAGVNHLHGGSAGYGVRFWEMLDACSDKVTLKLNSADRDGGYPGNLMVMATYEIVSMATLRLTVSAQSDADTLINLCHHPYFNLDGHRTIDNHQLKIESRHYLPADEYLIPTGEVASADNTDFDYSSLRTVGAGPYNNTYCLHERTTGDLRLSATLKASDQVMELWTTQPGLHLYDGYKLEPTEFDHQGRHLGARSGLCLEAQAWPDSPNHSHFPDASLRKDTLYQQISEYRFKNPLS